MDTGLAAHVENSGRWSWKEASDQLLRPDSLRHAVSAPSERASSL